MPELNLNEYLLKTASRDKWERAGSGKRAGVLIPLFSLYSRQSLGIGDFADLKLVIDWAKLTGNSIIQLLPMNEVGILYCPYDSVSSFALEPMYLSLVRLAGSETIKKKIREAAKLFPAGKTYVNYQVKKQKLDLLWEIFCEISIPDSAQLQEFIYKNIYWLTDFALFKIIKEYQGKKPWYEWEVKFKHRDKPALENFQKEHAKEIAFQIWLQWESFKQFQEVKKYAESKGTLLKGDLPILVSRDSADAWSHQEFFKLEFAAGAPPDMYCAKGQRWGMPTYNWERITSNNYKYLKEKLKYAQNFYDILRIDHVVGLFRIWSIPYQEAWENQGLNGFFDPQDETRWEERGRNILSVILNSADTLLCAEDLGVVPKVCTDTLKKLGILGNDVQRWAKDYKVKHDFLEPKDYRSLSVAMLSTHDTTNWTAWWENEAGTVDEGLFMRRCADHRQINFNRVKDKLFDSNRSGHGRLRWLNSIDSVDKLVSILGRRKEELADFIDMYENTYREKEKLWSHLKIKGPMREKSDAEIVKAALKISLASSAVFCINTIIDWLYLADIFKGDSYQYRINTPGSISEKNWSLVIPIPLEELFRHRMNKEMQKMIIDSRRID